MTNKEKVKLWEFLANIKVEINESLLTELLSGLLKTPKQSIIANLAGGKASVVKLTNEELEIAKTVAEGIKEDVFLRLDMIIKLQK